MYKEGTYAYSKKRDKYEICKIQGNAFIPTGEEFFNQLDAKIRTYELNGWSKKLKVTFKTGKVSMYEMPSELDLKNYLYFKFRVPSKNYKIERV